MGNEVESYIFLLVYFASFEWQVSVASDQTIILPPLEIRFSFHKPSFSSVLKASIFIAGPGNMIHKPVVHMWWPHTTLDPRRLFFSGADRKPFFRHLLYAYGKSF